MESLATKYRPKTFEEVCAQSVVVKILKKQLETGKIAHAYLFAGSTGCGKTTLSRILANEINHGYGDPIEIDAASNNGVNQVRAIVESANQRSLVGEYKIFIIDECHAITKEGWQAFLKSIEETPEYTIYMFCTTDPNKIPETILNRVQRYNIAKIPLNLIKNRLLYICQQEGYINYEETCDVISKLADGCMRDAIQLLDKCAGLSKDLSIENTEDVLGSNIYGTMFGLTWALQTKDEGKILTIINDLYTNGKDLNNFINDYLAFVLELKKFSVFKDINVTTIPAYLATKDNDAVGYTMTLVPDINTWLNKAIEALLNLKFQIKYDTSYKTTIEAYLLNLTRNA